MSTQNVIDLRVRVAESGDNQFESLVLNQYKMHSNSFTLSSSNWVNHSTYYEQIVTGLTGVTAFSEGVLSLAQGVGSTVVQAAARAQLQCVFQSTESITVRCYGVVPPVDIPCYIVNRYEPYLSELCFTANTAGSTIELIKVGDPSISDTAYSVNGSTWTSFTPSTASGTNTVTLNNVGDKVYFRNTIIENFATDSRLQFVMTGSISASGNVNSLYSATGFDALTTLAHSYCYYLLFKECTALTTAPKLPATSLADADGCYGRMFSGCTSLTRAPKLPATVLSQSCYLYMFYNCTSLITPPTLAALTLAPYCYQAMFLGCRSLQVSPILPATTMTTYCYNSMFSGCESLIQITTLPATTLASSCYATMFSGCTALQISSTQTAAAPYSWAVPSGSAITGTGYPQTGMFTSCLGTRSSNDLAGLSGSRYVYYTQNQPLS